MKGTITVVGNEIKLALDPENDVERLVFRELGDDMSISRCHNSIVLRRRGPIVHSLTDDEDNVGEVGEDSEREVANTTFIEEVSSA